MACLDLSLPVTQNALLPAVLLAAVIGGVACLTVDFSPPPSLPQASEVGKGLPRFVSATLRSHVGVSLQEIHKHLQCSHSVHSHNAPLHIITLQQCPLLLFIYSESADLRCKRPKMKGKTLMKSL